MHLGVLEVQLLKSMHVRIFLFCHVAFSRSSLSVSHGLPSPVRKHPVLASIEYINLFNSSQSDR